MMLWALTIFSALCSSVALEIKTGQRQARAARAVLRPGLAGVPSPTSSLLELGTLDSSGEDSVTTGELHGPAPALLYGTIYVGTPPQEFRVLFDTGSNSVVLPSRKCQSVACLSHGTYDASSSATARTPSAAQQVSFVVGVGRVTGNFTEDKVCLGPDEIACAKTSFVEATEMSDEPFSLFPYDGIVGLGLPTATSAVGANLMGNLAQERALKSNRFAIWLATEADREDSEVTFGTVSESRVGSPSFVWLPLSTTTSGMWQVKMTDLTANMVPLRLCEDVGCQAAFDTGTAVLGGPKRVIDAVLTALSVQKDCSNFNTLPTLGFAFPGFTLNLDPNDYVTKTPEGCYPQFLAVETPLLLLGSPFLRRYYTVYDRESLRVGIAFAKHKTLPGEETTEKAAARLMVRQTAAVTPDVE